MVALGAVCLSAPGCGSSRQEEAASEALRSALAAFSAGDAGALCRELSRKAKLVIGHARHRYPPIDCQEDVSELLESIRPYANGFQPRPVRLERTAPGRAVAVYALPAGTRAAIPMRVEDGVWKLDGLFDADLSLVQARTAPDSQSVVTEDQMLVVAKVPSPVEPADSLRAVDRRGSRCPAVSVERYPELAGGCVSAVTGRGVRISLQTPFGFMEFARCRISYQLRLDGAGRAWIENFDIAGQSPCLDILPCLARPDSKIVPWQALIAETEAGGHRLRVEDACLDTCIGRFQGGWELDLASGDRGHPRLRSAAVVGASGWRFDGSFSSRDEAFRIEAMH